MVISARKYSSEFKTKVVQLRREVVSKVSSVFNKYQNREEQLKKYYDPKKPSKKDR